MRSLTSSDESKVGESTLKGSKAVFSKREPLCHESINYCNRGFLDSLQKRSPNCKFNAMNAAGNCG